MDGLSSKDEIELLQAKLESLKIKYSFLINEIASIIKSDTYQTILKIDDWNLYFESQKRLLEKEFDELKDKYVAHE